MKAIRLHQVDGPESLLYEETPKPIPKNNQVLVQVYATAITPTEFAWYPTFHTPEGGIRPFPLFWVMNSRALSKRSGRIAPAYRWGIISMD